MRKKSQVKKLTITVKNPPSKEQAQKLVEEISEFLRVKYYS